MIRKFAQVSPVGIAGLAAIVLSVVALRASSGSEEQNWTNQDWTNYVRIGAYGLKSTNALEIVRGAQEDGVFGIEVDNDIPGRYESLVNPEEKLKAIRAVAQQAHAVGNKAFVYIAGTEFITANSDKNVLRDAMAVDSLDDCGIYF